MFDRGGTMAESNAREPVACNEGGEGEAAGAFASDPTLALIEQRSSTRRFAGELPVTEAQREAVLHAASRAPSAGAMMMYSIIDIREQAALDRLMVLVDNQLILPIQQLELPTYQQRLW